MKSIYEWEVENSKADKFELSEDQRRNSLDKPSQENKKTRKNKESYLGSQKDLNECR